MGRQPLDFYETPAEYVLALADALPNLNGQTVFDPCVGKGAISERLYRAYRIALLTNDIDPQRPADYHMDATLSDVWDQAYTDSGDGIDFAITNPPFTPDIMQGIITNALHYSRNTIMLARLSFLEPTESRRLWWEDKKPDMCIVLPRYSFGLNKAGKRGNDSVTCCWLGWGPDISQGIDICLDKPSWRR